MGIYKMKCALLIFYRICSPWRYLRIKEESDFYFLLLNWIFPCALSLIPCIIIAILDIGFNFKFARKILFCSGDFCQLFSFFPGFFLAALGAVAVIEQKCLDYNMPNSNLTIDIRIDGQAMPKIMTRRLYLCLLFSFLTVQSFLFCVFLFCINHFGKKTYSIIYNWLFSKEIQWLSYASVIVVLFICAFVFFQILLIMLIGMYYLGERFPSKIDS